jgi:hypothetical protein
MDNMKYKILSETSISRLEGNVYLILKEGGTLVGGPFTSMRTGYGREAETIFHQAVMDPREY